MHAGWADSICGALRLVRGRAGWALPKARARRGERRTRRRAAAPLEARAVGHPLSRPALYRQHADGGRGCQSSPANGPYGSLNGPRGHGPSALQQRAAAGHRGCTKQAAGDWAGPRRRHRARNGHGGGGRHRDRGREVWRHLRWPGLFGMRARRARQDSNLRPTAQKLSRTERCSHQRKPRPQPSVIAKVIWSQSCCGWLRGAGYRVGCAAQGLEHAGHPLASHVTGKHPPDRAQ